MTLSAYGRTGNNVPRLKPRPKWATALRNRRDELGMSQEEIAEVIGDLVSQSAISDLETGRADLTKMETRRIVALARALKWSLGELQQATGIDLAVDLPPSNLENKFEGIYIPIYGKVSAGSNEPEPLDEKQVSTHHVPPCAKWSENGQVFNQI